MKDVSIRDVADRWGHPLSPGNHRTETPRALRSLLTLSRVRPVLIAGIGCIALSLPTTTALSSPHDWSRIERDFGLVVRAEPESTADPFVAHGSFPKDWPRFLSSSRLRDWFESGYRVVAQTAAGHRERAPSWLGNMSLSPNPSLALTLSLSLLLGMLIVVAGRISSRWTVALVATLSGGLGVASTLLAGLNVGALDLSNVAVLPPTHLILGAAAFTRAGWYRSRRVRRSYGSLCLGIGLCALAGGATGWLPMPSPFAAILGFTTAWLGRDDSRRAVDLGMGYRSRAPRALSSIERRSPYVRRGGLRIR